MSFKLTLFSSVFYCILIYANLCRKTNLTELLKSFQINRLPEKNLLVFTGLPSSCVFYFLYDLLSIWKWQLLHKVSFSLYITYKKILQVLTIHEVPVCEWDQ